MKKKVQENLLRSLSRKLKSQHSKAHIPIPVKSTTHTYTWLCIFFPASRKTGSSKYEATMSAEEALNLSRNTVSKAWLGLEVRVVRNNSHKSGQWECLRLKEVKPNVTSMSSRYGIWTKIFFMKPSFEFWLSHLLAVWFYGQ